MNSHQRRINNRYCNRQLINLKKLIPWIALKKIPLPNINQSYHTIKHKDFIFHLACSYSPPTHSWYWQPWLWKYL